jgi:chromosome segregation ATPase
MKDKKSIAIVMLAAITAGIGIFSIVSNQSKLDAYAKVKAERNAIQKERDSIRVERDDYRTQRDQLDTERQTLEESVQIQDKRIVELNAEVETEKTKATQLDMNLTQKTTEMDTLKLQHAQDLGAVETKLQEVNTAKMKAEKELVKTAADLKAQTTELKEFQTKVADETKQRVELIAALETKNDTLNQEKGALEVKIANLNTEIEETNQKLDDSEGDRTFLEGELLRLQDEKAVLVKQMNDLEFLSAQVKRIKSDIAVAKRMDWMRRGIGIYAKQQTVAEKHAALRAGKAGGQPVSAEGSENENVSVELTSDGRVIINGKVIEPEAETAPESETAPETPVAPAPVPPAETPTPTSSEE